MKGARLVAGVLAALLAGCSTQVEKAPASLPIPSQWREQVGPSAPPEAAWWQAFGDRDLNRLVEQALQHNPDILIARSRVDQYRAQLRGAEGDNFPTLSGGVAATRQRALSAVTGQPYETSVFRGSFRPVTMSICGAHGPIRLMPPAPRWRRSRRPRRPQN